MPPTHELHLTDTCRLVPSLYPSRGILDAVATPADLPLVLELESWSNDRISEELGALHRIPPRRMGSGPSHVECGDGFVLPSSTGRGPFQQRGTRCMVCRGFAGRGACGGHLPSRGGAGGGRDIRRAGTDAAVPGRLSRSVPRCPRKCGDERSLPRSGELSGILAAGRAAFGGKIERGYLSQCEASGRRVPGLFSSGVGGECAERSSL
jgi:hypothetical protein